ncbi:Monoacylglycerol lipase abhd12 [Phlyctochytrium planicorne]|nr:Monoacylglycerol lipase abhd12 [Phlyctochytrium planicorne]
MAVSPSPSRWSPIAVLVRILSFLLFIYVVSMMIATSSSGTIVSLALLFPYEVQPYLIYLHWVNFPFDISRDSAERFGFRAGVLRNIRIPSTDGVILGGWHILSHSESQPILSKFHSNDDDYFDMAMLKASRIFLYFHGNAGNRATFVRPAFYKNLNSMNPESHVVAVDYRGFGDSVHKDGGLLVPSEVGVRDDAYMTLKWIESKGVSPDKIVLVGHSLGSGVASFLARNMTLEGKPPAALVIVAGYASIPDASLYYPTIPLLRPFTINPISSEYAKSKVVERWETFRAIRDVKCPILLVHGHSDVEIQIWQAKLNFYAAVEGRLAFLGSQKTLTQATAEEIARADEALDPTTFSDGLFSVRPIGKGAKEGRLWLSSAESNIEKSEKPHVGDVWLLEITYAGHNDIGKFQIFVDALQEFLSHHQQ